MLDQPQGNMSKQEYAVEVPGVPPELRSIAQADVRKLVHSMAGAADKLGIPFLLQRVRFTDRFEEDVNHLLQEQSGITGYVAGRNNAQAVAKTIWTRSREGDFGFSHCLNKSVTQNKWLPQVKCY